MNLKKVYKKKLDSKFKGTTAGTNIISTSAAPQDININVFKTKANKKIE